MCMLVARVVSLSIDRTKPKLGGGDNDAVKNTNTNEIQILFAGYHKPAKLGKLLLISRNFAEFRGSVLSEDISYLGIVFFRCQILLIHYLYSPSGSNLQHMVIQVLKFSSQLFIPGHSLHHIVKQYLYVNHPLVNILSLWSSRLLVSLSHS
jgi:hypothetical protein